MEKFDKTNLMVIAVAALLVLVLIIVMICGACSGKKDTNWNPLTSGSTTDTTGNTTGNSTGDSTQDSTQNQTDGTAGTGPQIDIGVIDRNEIDNVLNQPTSGTKPTTPTTPTTGGTTGTTNSQPTTKPTEAAKPTEKPKPSETTKPTETTESTTNPETTTPTTEELKLLTWEEWDALRREEKSAYRNAFPTHDDFKQWYYAAQAQYDSTKPTTDGNIALGGGK